MEIFIFALIIVLLAIILILGKRYFNGPACHVRTNLKGKCIFITGANTGLGE